MSELEMYAGYDGYTGVLLTSLEVRVIISNMITRFINNTDNLTL